MKFSFKFRLLAVFAILLFLAGTKVEAQGVLNLTVTSSASSLLVSNNLTYTIIVTNNFALLPSAVVSNTLPATVQFVSANPGSGVTFVTNASGVVFNITGFSIGTFAQMTLTVHPTQVGFVTNLVQFFTPNATNAPATNVVTQVTNTPPVQADLGVAITVPKTTIITNDLMTYGVSVTNAGPDAAPGVILTNTLPSGVILKGNYTVVSNNLIFNLGTMASGAFTNFQFTIQPTNAGVLNFFAAVGAPGVFDPNVTNNTASNSIAITNYLVGTLTASVTSTQLYNPQNGLVEQTITVANAGPASIPAARVIVTGLTNQQLYNVAGTNNGNPFVVYISSLASGQSVTLLLQFFAANYFTLANSQLQAFAVPVPNLAPPVVSSTSPNLVISRILPLSNGYVLIEFPSTAGKTYTVVYSDNASFSNAKIAPPSVVAGANRKQWVDYGPPTTWSVPSTVPARFYRVIQNP